MRVKKKEIGEEAEEKRERVSFSEKPSETVQCLARNSLS